MALDPEEFKKRRAQKAQQRQSQQRGMTVRLVIAGVALLLVGVLIIVVALSRAGGTPEDPAPGTTVQLQPEASVPETTAPPAQTVIRLAAAGDLNVTQRVVDAGGTAFDYTNTFMDVAHLLADADITVLNLEGNLYGQPYGADRSAPQTMMQALQRAGVDLVQLANSYSIYKGMDGLAKTIEGVRLAGMEPLGVRSSNAESEKNYTIRTVNGVKIAFVAFTKGMDGMALPAGNEGCVNVLYEDYSTDYQSVDTAGITWVLDQVEKEKPDLTVALLHWGSEFNNNISESQKRICTLLQGKGVDAIIGTHSHYVQQMQFDPQSGTFVAFSLGDFAGDADRAGSEYSVILELEITKDNESGNTAITGYSYTPIFTVVEEEKPLKVVRIREAMAAFESEHIDKISQQTYDAMTYALERIEARIHPKKTQETS